MAETRNPGSGGGANCCRVPGLVERLGPQDSVDCRLESDSSGVARFAVEAECWQRAQERDYAGRKIAQVILLCLAAIILFTLFLGVANAERKREAIEAMRQRESSERVERAILSPVAEVPPSTDTSIAWRWCE